jgi:hypothetical protein
VSSEPRTTGMVRGPVEALPAWLAFGVAALAVLVTYARLPPSELYNVSEDGLDGGLGRALVFLNFPVALAAVPFALLAAAILRHRAASVAALLVVASAALVPFVVDQGDLDAKPANALPAAGVALALLLTLAAARRRGVRPARTRLRGDPLRILLAALLLVVAVPWVFAELGFYAPDPVLADEPSPDEPLAAVHLGHHHGTDGVLLALAALALSRVPPRLPRSLLASAASGCLAAMLVYGVGNAVQDAWLEQVVKRGTTEHGIPSIVKPEPLEAAVLLLAAAVVELAWFRRERLGRRSGGGRPSEPSTDRRLSPGGSAGSVR